MLFRKKVKKKAGPIELTVDRESVCMGDDVTAPNEKIFPVAENETLSDVMEKICAYLPKMNDVVWSVDTGIKTEAYIVMETKNRYWYELCEQDKRFAETEIHYLHCRYFHTGRFLYRDQMSGERIEKYPECGELLDKVKCFMGEYFKEELKIKGGSVCISRTLRWWKIKQTDLWSGMLPGSCGPGIYMEKSRFTEICVCASIERMKRD